MGRKCRRKWEWSRWYIKELSNISLSQICKCKKKNPGKKDLLYFYTDTCFRYLHMYVYIRNFWHVFSFIPEPKAQVSFLIEFVCCCWLNFHHFHPLLQSQQGNFNLTWHKASIQVCSNEGSCSFPIGDRINGPISTKLDTHNPWVKRI